MTEEEIDNLQIGQVFLYGDKKIPRIVRGLCRGGRRSRTNNVKRVNVAIKKCSWTGRCDTFVDRYFLKHYCEWTPMIASLDSEYDEAFREEERKLKRRDFIPDLTCCGAKKYLL